MLAMMYQGGKYYDLIRNIYGDKKAERSQVPYINHINEGIIILDELKSSMEAVEAFCLHPLLQLDADFLENKIHFTTPYNTMKVWPVVLAMEYRSVANEYLSRRKIKDISEIRLSPMKEVNQMLIADKIQNCKDFSLNRHLYSNANELDTYFHNWFERLGITTVFWANCMERLYKEDQKTKWKFPLRYCTGIPMNPHPGAFGYPRKDYRHTGVDLYTNDNEPVYAMEDGVVVGIEPFTGVKDASPWWYNTDCILVEGKSGVICYGEIEALPEMKVGVSVVAGQRLAHVRRVILHGRERPDIPGHSPSMLHVELYYHGRKSASNGFDEKILRDPTPHLLSSINRPTQVWVYANYVPGTYGAGKLPH